MRSSLAATLLAAILPAQECKLVADINQDPRPVSSHPSLSRVRHGGAHTAGLPRLGDSWFFHAHTETHGRELWKTDGTPKGTVRVADIRPGREGSSMFDFAKCTIKGKELLVFQGDDGKTGAEPWVTDGTAQGTRRIADVVAGAGSSRPRHFECLKDRIVFSAFHPATGTELWSSDLTASGTKLLKDIRSGSAHSLPSSLLADSARNLIVFSATDANGTELWKTDGTTAGTVLLKDIRPGASSSHPATFVNHGGTMLFVATGGNGRELWTTDGTSAGTIELMDIWPGFSSSQPSLSYGNQSKIGNDLFFWARVVSYQLWKTDGTRAGTVRVGGAFPLPPREMRAVGKTLFFTAQFFGGQELWKSDGTAAGIVLVKDIYPGSRSSQPRGFTPLPGGKVAFVADTGRTGTGLELWASDGTTSGTNLVKDILPGAGSARPSNLTAIGNARLLFSATDAAHGGELWTTDGTALGTKLMRDIEPEVRTASANVGSLGCAWGNTLYFVASDRIGPAIFKMEAGRHEIVRRLAAAGPTSANGFTATWLGGRTITLFGGRDDAHGYELWVTDGTAPGTVLFKDLSPGPSNSWPSGFTQCGDKVFFTATNANGRELWVTDGTAAGTFELRDIWHGARGSNPRDFVCFDDKLYFAVDDGRRGSEIWVSDGTKGGTVLFKDVWPGAWHGYAGGLTRAGDKLVFAGDDSRSGAELWISDGTPGGTTMLRDLRPGRSGSRPTKFCACGDKVYFRADDGRSGAELWVTDFTAAGTTMVADIAAGSSSSNPDRMVRGRDRLYFVATQKATGTELWSSDGTRAGTKIVADLNPGAASSSPENTASIGSRVYFSAITPSAGRELMVTDGTARGTKVVCDVYPRGWSSPRPLHACAGRIWFVARSLKHGVELFRIDDAGAVVEPLGLGTRATLDSGAPILGATTTLRGHRAPPNHFGVLLASVPIARPVTLPSSAGATWVDLSGAIGTPVPAGRSWRQPIRIPNDSTLKKGTAVLQVLYVNRATTFPLQATNALQWRPGS